MTNRIDQNVHLLENICSIIKRKIEKIKTKNIDELELFLAEQFKNVTINIAKKLS